jgi:RNA 2',3'-cyclic 3'-phosphodiesterase
MARLFYALWPDRQAREALAAHGARLARGAGGRAVPAANLHLTLVFLGEVEPARVASLHRAAGEVESPGFELALDEVGSFRGSGVAWAGCRVAPPALLALQAALAERLRLQGFTPEARPFAPHLTLVRRIAAPVAREAIAPVSWRVKGFALVESDRARGGYANVADWPLRDGTG